MHSSHVSEVLKRPQYKFVELQMLLSGNYQIIFDVSL